MMKYMFLSFMVGILGFYVGVLLGDGYLILFGIITIVLSLVFTTELKMSENNKKRITRSNRV